MFLCFNEGNSSHDSCVLYMENLNVQWQMRVSDSILEPYVVLFSWRVMFSVANLSQSDEAWNNHSAKITKKQQVVSLHRFCNFFCNQAGFSLILRKGNKSNCEMPLVCHFLFINKTQEAYLRDLRYEPNTDLKMRWRKFSSLGELLGNICSAKGHACFRYFPSLPVYTEDSD